jgi:hypothetical protein
MSGIPHEADKLLARGLIVAAGLRIVYQGHIHFLVPPLKRPNKYEIIKKMLKSDSEDSSIQGGSVDAHFDYQ